MACHASKLPFESGVAVKNSMNTIENMKFLLNFENPPKEVPSERELFDFAHGPLIETIDCVMNAAECNDDIVIDSLTLELNVSQGEDLYDRILQTLREVLEEKLKKTVYQTQSAPVIRSIAEVYRQHLPAEHSSNLEMEFDTILESWKGNHSDQKFDSLSFAETVIRKMQKQYPYVDAQQVAYAVFQKMMQLKNKKAVQQTSVFKNAILESPKLLGTFDSGIVLISPYLPALLERVGCVEKGKFISEDAKRKAVAVLKFAAFGTYKEPPENAAVMNLLCDLPASPVISAEELPELSQAEKDLVESLLQALIANWKAVGHMSTDGLRGTYFVRNGKLNLGDSVNVLTVENKTYDILLEKLPWGYSMIKHPWMKKVLNVKWR